MNQFIRVFLFVISELALSGCGVSSDACKIHNGLAELRSLKVERAANNAAASFDSGNDLLLGVYGYSVEIPGLVGDPYKHMNETRMLEGTSDAFCTEEEEILNKNARIYARKYNEAMLGLIGSNRQKKYGSAIKPDSKGSKGGRGTQ